MAVAFDASGAAGNTLGTSFSFSHTATAGADVFLFINPDRQVTSLTSIDYGSTAMTLLGSIPHNNNDASFGSLYVYHAANVSGGAQTVSGSWTTSAWFTVNSVSYTGVGSVGTLQTAFGASTSPSSGSISCTTGQMIVCGIGVGNSAGGGTLSAATGGTNRYLATNGASDGGLCISDSTATATFGCTVSGTGSSDDWGTAAVVLSPLADPTAGAQITTQIPNQFVGPMALRGQKRQPQQVQSVLAYPPTSSLTDIFASTNSNWTYTLVTVGNNQVLLPCTTSSNRFQTTGTYDLTGSYITLEVIQLPPVGTGTTELLLYVFPTGNQYFTTNAYVYFWNNNNLVVSREAPGGGLTQVFSVAYNANTMRFWRIRGASNGINFDTSPDGVSWTNQYSEQPFFRLSDIQVVVRCSYFGSETNPGPAIVGYYNLLPSPQSYQPTIIPNPQVGPMALRQQKRLPYVGARSAAGNQSLSDGANSTWTFTTSDDGFVQPGGLMPPLQIPNPFVGPQALRNQKRMPYVSSQRQGYTDGANQTVTFTTSDDGFVQPGGVMPPLQIPNPFVGPQALRNQKRMPYVASQRQGYTDGANVTVTVTTSDDGFVQPGGVMPPLQIPNPFVGPMALRQSKKMPYVASQRQGYTDGANQTITVTTSDDGFVQPGGLMPPLQIPNPYVGPQALRNAKRMPYVPYRAAPGAQSISDGANTTITFSTSDDGFVQPGGVMPPLQIPNPFVGPMALRNAKRMPYVASQRQGYTDGANLSISFNIGFPFTFGFNFPSLDGFVQPSAVAPSLQIPNPFVGPMALRNRKRMPYVASRSSTQQNLSDGANSTWTFTTSTDGHRGITDGANQTIVFTTTEVGFVQPVGLMPPLQIPNPHVGPMALRQSKRLPYVASQRQGYTDAANQTIVFTTSTDGTRGTRDGANTTIVFATSDDGFVQPGGKMPPLVIANPFVGPQALRQTKRMPYVAYQRQGYTDAANQTILFTTSDDGFVEHPHFVPITIPNPYVGPMAMRNRKRMPYVPSGIRGLQNITDGANSTWVFTTSTNGKLTIKDGANSTWVFTTSTDGHRGITDGANTTITWTVFDDGFVDHKGAKTSVVIPTPLVGPMALRHSKRMPYETFRSASFADAANTTVVFSDVPAGVRAIRDGANVTITAAFVTTSGQRHIFDGANRAITVGVTAAGRLAIKDAANLHIAFSVSDDGNVHPFIIDVNGTVVVGPNEIRSVVVPARIWTTIVTQAEGWSTIVYNAED